MGRGLSPAFLGDAGARDLDGPLCGATAAGDADAPAQLRGLQRADGVPGKCFPFVFIMKMSYIRLQMKRQQNKCEKQSAAWGRMSQSTCCQHHYRFLDEAEAGCRDGEGTGYALFFKGYRFQMFLSPAVRAVAVSECPSRPPLFSVPKRLGRTARQMLLSMAGPW